MLTSSGDPEHHEEDYEDREKHQEEELNVD